VKIKMKMKIMELPGMSDTASARVEMLGWGDDLLSRAADWLVTEFGDQLDGVLIAVPGARAGRTLQEEIARRLAPSVSPPHVLTAGDLTDELLELHERSADRLTRTMVWERALRGLDLEVRKRIVSREPSVFGAWFRLAELLRTLHGELATEGISFRDVVKEEFGEDNAGEEARWEALAQAQEAYREVLQGLELKDPHEARWEALRADQIDASRRVVLVGVADPNELVRAVVKKLGAEVTSLVFAPPELRAAFDEIGAVDTEVWRERDIPLRLDLWQVVDKPADQASAVFDWIARLEGAHSAEEISVGICDDEVAPFLERRFGAKGIWARHGAGITAGETSAVKLLDVVGRYLAAPKFRALATALRHPELESCVSRECDLSDKKGRNRDLAECLDLYYDKHLPDAGDGSWIEGKKGSAERAVLDAHSALLACLAELKGGGVRPLCEWAGPLRSFLEKVYTGVSLDPNDESERAELEGLRAVVSAISEVELLPAALGAGQVQAYEAIELIHRCAVDVQIPPAASTSGTPTIELLGWLELALDDAEAMIVTGFNEGSVPETVQGHPFLPETLRQSLGVPSNADRQARDAYTTTLLTQRKRIGFLSGRRAMEGDPRLPSRLAFQAPESECVERAKHMLRIEGAELTEPPKKFDPPGLPKSSESTAVESMRVTDFKLYLESPYRYYLLRVLGYETMDDSSRELSPRWFGILAHHALEVFGESAKKDSTDPEEIFNFLVQQLEARVHEQYGEEPLPAIAVQKEQIKVRYRAFAAWQAKRAAAGWSIVHTEWKPESGGYLLDVDGEPMKITGRVDRIDRHLDGRWAILDYKAADKPARPSSRPQKPEDWKDLQLPLYSLLTTELGIEDLPELGYVTLARDTAEIHERIAKWDTSQLEDAVEAAKEVVRRVRDEDFFIPGKLPKYDDITRAVLGDGVLSISSSDDEDEEEDE
jgi:ATP-dependent helicase/nuclease subunit B